MSTRGKTERDFPGGYMNPGKIEKAPDGFTRKLMERIEAEALPVRKSFRLTHSLRIPAIAALIAAGLIIVSVLAGKAESSLVIAIGEKLKSYNIALRELNKVSLPEFSVPQIFVYISVGLLVLWVFDLGLNRLFNKSRE